MARDRLLIGVGKLALNGVLIDNPTTLEVDIEVETFSLRNAGQVGGGVYAEKTRIAKITWSATVHDYSAKMLARHFRGDSAEVAAAAVVDEPQTVVKNGLIPTDTMLDVDETVTIIDGAGVHATSTAFAVNSWINDGTHLYAAIVGGTTAGAAPTFPTDGSTVVDGTVTWQDMGVFAAVADTDFAVSAAGVTDLGLGMLDGAPIKISYTTRDGESVEIATKAITAIPVTFDGYNEDDDTPLVANLHRNDVASSGGVPLITEEYGAATITGTVLIDDTQPVGKSRYGKITWGNERVV